MTDVKGNASSPSLDDAAHALATMRLSLDQEQPDAAPSTPEGGAESKEDALRRELERTRAEKDALEDQYQTLVEKVTAMRTTLGNKLRQDAEELDRREQAIQSLTEQLNEQATTIDTITTELVASNDEAERVLRELDALRGRALEDTAYEQSLRSRDAAELERTRLERDEWERTAQDERVAAEEYKAQIDSLSRSLELVASEKNTLAQSLREEKQNSTNLQSVLEDFQTVKDLEMRQTVADYESRLQHVTNLLAEFKHRAYTAEEELSSSSSNAQRTAELEKEVKEKSLLIGKLRHETVIINEHLTEALRRLRKSSSDTSVDRRLVTNILLQFLTTNRTDPKRFEMLQLLSSILSWDDNDREKAGLQRSGAVSGKRGVLGGLSKIPESNQPDETESFSKMWVEFLLKESTSSPASPPPSSLSPAPSFPPPLSPIDGKAPRTLRSASSSSLGGASSPNLNTTFPNRET